MGRTRTLIEAPAMSGGACRRSYRKYPRPWSARPPRRENSHAGHHTGVRVLPEGQTIVGGVAEERAEIVLVTGPCDQNRTPTPTTASVSLARTTFIWP